MTLRMKRLRVALGLLPLRFVRLLIGPIRFEKKYLQYSDALLISENAQLPNATCTNSINTRDRRCIFRERRGFP